MRAKQVNLIALCLQDNIDNTLFWIDSSELFGQQSVKWLHSLNYYDAFV